MDEQTANIIDFCVFVFHHLAASWKMPVPEVFRRLSSADIVNGYLIPCYDVLHTLGAEYLVEDVTDLARERGVLA